MRKQIKKWAAAFGAIVIVTVGGVAMANDSHHGGAYHGQQMMQNLNLANYMEEQDGIMANMMKEMQDIPKSGMPAIDFLNGMIPHHKAAIEMSESLLKYGGENKAIKKIAEDVIRVQTTEIAQMDKMIRDLKANKAVDKAKETAYLKEYNKMFDGTMSHSMPHAMTNLKSVDQAFAEGMIMHHEMAVEMSKAILEHTDQAKIKDMAQEIIKVQLQEISQMKELIRGMQ